MHLGPPSPSHGQVCVSSKPKPAACLYVHVQGVPCTIDDHLLIVGDAAGHIDPLTGASESVELA
eukprot:1159951-Pelagomonas_calceolata.AAC.4